MARGHTVRVGRPRSKKQWFGTSDQGAQAVASGAKAIIQSLNVNTPSTILRNRGILAITPQAGSADLEIDGAYGIAVVTDVALALGITAIPGPFTESSWTGWMVHQFFHYQLDVTTDVGRVGGTGFSRQYEIDSKAMRKMGDSERMVEIVESRSGALFCLGHVRTLVLMS